MGLRLRSVLDGALIGAGAFSLWVWFAFLLLNPGLLRLPAGYRIGALCVWDAALAIVLLALGAALARRLSDTRRVDLLRTTALSWLGLFSYLFSWGPQGPC